MIKIYNYCCKKCWQWCISKIDQDDKMQKLDNELDLVLKRHEKETEYFNCNHGLSRDFKHSIYRLTH